MTKKMSKPADEFTEPEAAKYQDVTAEDVVAGLEHALEQKDKRLGELEDSTFDLMIECTRLAITSKLNLPFKEPGGPFRELQEEYFARYINDLKGHNVDWFGADLTKATMDIN